MSTADRPPSRLVFFGGPYLQPGAVRFAAMLEEHPEVELILGLCASEGTGFRHRLGNLWSRRGPIAILVLGLDFAEGAWRWLSRPRESWRLRRLAARVKPRFEFVKDIHAPEVIRRVQAIAPDLGVIYGAPILKPDLFSIPRLGTLGIHHGRVPAYRGKKTTFWEMYNGERTAGITIQRVNPGIDTGDVIATGAVKIGRKSYGRVWREVEELGCELYLKAILEVRHGCASPVPQPPRLPKDRLYRQPSPRDLLTFWTRRLMGRRPPGAGA